jgi:rubredoxin
VIWLEQLRFKFLYKLARLVSVKPFIKIDPNKYCPACGHTKGRILAVTDGTRVNIRHLCEVCQWIYEAQTVTDIPKESIVSDLKQESKEEPTAEELAQPRDKFERFVRVTRKDFRINGQPLSE